MGVSNTWVKGFDGFASGVKWVGDTQVLSPVKSTVNFLAANLSADGLKWLVAKPAVLLGSFLGRETSYPAIAEMCSDLGKVKLVISGLEVITKMPKMFEMISNPIKEKEETRLYCVKYGNEFKKGEDKYLSGTQAVFSRLFWVANWIISAGDAIGYVRNYTPISKGLENATPWVYTLAGGYMACYGLYAEKVFSDETWRSSSAVETIRAEKAYGALSIATSVSYLFLSIMSAVGIYCKDAKPAWVQKLQFAANAGAVIVPAVHKVATYYMKATYWEPAAKLAADEAKAALEAAKSKVDVD